MTEVKLRDLRGLLGGVVDRNQGLTYTAKPLLGPGENYGSTMLAVDVKVTTENGKETKEHHYVAKMCPPTDLLKEMFNTKVTYKKEIALYTEIVPLLQQFQREQGVADVIDFFPKLEGSRISLDPNSDLVDDDAVMLLRNLKYEGYEVVDRFDGFDLECGALIMRDLAKFHAVPLALKLKRPDEFERIRAHLTWPFEFKINDDIERNVVADIVKTAEGDEECAGYIAKIKLAFANGRECVRNKPPAREPFATLTHNDYWVNNTLIKFENGRPIKNVMVDFQILEYGSPADDVIFFLYSSVNPAVLENSYDTLITLYFDTFIETLQQLNCDVHQFTVELFREELDIAARTVQFYHTMVMLLPIFTKRGTSKELADFKEEDLLRLNFADEFPAKVRFVVRDFAKRGWI